MVNVGLENQEGGRGKEVCRRSGTARVNVE
jgi:hypothetical protein